ncbi:unnamed protein product, partial [Tuber aestivum]
PRHFEPGGSPRNVISLPQCSLLVLELGRDWLDVYDPDPRNRYVPPDSGVYPPAIYYSSLLNLVTVCELLLGRKEDTVNVNSPGGSYGNALQAAAHMGNESVVRLLLVHR